MIDTEELADEGDDDGDVGDLRDLVADDGVESRSAVGLHQERPRITAFDEIDICEHSDPTDSDQELSE